MRIRLVVPVDVDAPTGGNVYDLSVARALVDAGHEVDVVRCPADDLAAVLGRSWWGATVVDGLLACPAPDAMLGSGAAVLVHMPLAWDPGLSPEQAADLDGRERQVVRTAPVVVATSAWVAADLRRRHGVERVAVARPGVEPAAVETGSDPPLLVQVAALLPNKDQLRVVRALRQVAELPWRARLVGSLDRDPRYVAQVRAAVSAAGLDDRVELPGALPREVAWAGVDLALLPSRAEAFGLVVTEALARGVPVVVGEGGAAEALGRTASGEVPGFVVSADDDAGADHPGPDALPHVLRRWMTDTGLRARLRAAALSRRATLPGWDVTAHELVMALSGSSPSPARPGS